MEYMEKKAQMEMQDSFQYTYSAKEQEELKQIREKYQPKEMDKMEQVRRLDASVTKKAAATAITLGSVGTLVMGTGMSLAMTNMGEILGLAYGVSMAVGIFVGICGIVMLGLAYPVYNGVLKRERERVAPEILRLTEELMK